MRVLGLGAQIRLAPTWEVLGLYLDMLPGKSKWYISLWKFAMAVGDAKADGKALRGQLPGPAL